MTAADSPSAISVFRFSQGTVFFIGASVNQDKRTSHPTRRQPAWFQALVANGGRGVDFSHQK
jgi:hypothetical protein